MSEMAADSCHILTETSNTDTPDKPVSTWNSLRDRVKEARRQSKSYVSRSPTNFLFRYIERDDGSVFKRLYFLGIPEGWKENTIMYRDIVPDTGKDGQQTTTMNTSLLHYDTSVPTNLSFSKEEQLLRERKRMDMFGITGYEYHEASARFVFAASNNLYICDDNQPNSTFKVIPTAIPTECPNVRLDPKICPGNANWVAFIHANDIWVADTTHGIERRLTFSQKSTGSHMTSGVPSFIVQEEFHRFTGYWWQPNCKEKEANIERILYEEVDESEVMTVNILNSPSDNSHVDEFKYPRAGTNNASCTLKIIELDRDSYGAIGTDIKEKQLQLPLKSYFPWCEYIARAGWTPNGHVWAWLFDRRQSRSSLILIQLNCFVSVPNSTVQVESTANHTIHVIYEEKSLVWITVNDVLHFFPQESSTEISFILASDKTGFRHLYFVTSSLSNMVTESNQFTMATDSTPVPWDTREDDEIKAIVLTEKPLTSGSWEVNPAQIWVDHSHGLVYFLGLKDSVLETHLYVTSYRLARRPQLLTAPGYSHSVEMDSTCTHYITAFSSINERVQANVYGISVNQEGLVTSQLLANLLPPSSECIININSPELFTFTSKAGHACHGMIFRPQPFRRNVKYPTILFVYGGPGVQLVNNSFKGLKFLRLNTLASEGYCVVSLDGRGSSCRGLHYESWIKNRLGTVEIEDQVEGLQWIASQVGYIDLDRVAIHGWSYGGYLSLLGLAQRPDIFKVAIAGAPVVQWTLYDTGYTERYIDLPNSNPDAYRLGSVLSYAANFPDEPNRLLIIHGLMDENVHIQHTMSLIDSLIQHCKPYLLQVYPSERHGIRGVEANDHCKTSLLHFLYNNL